MWQASCLFSPSAAFVVVFHIESSVGQQVLDKSTVFAVLSSVVEFMYPKSMVCCVVRCRQVEKSGSRDLSFYLQCVELDSTVDLYMTFQVENLHVP